MARLTIAEKLQQYVDAGAAYLDVVRPGWEFKIDIAELNLSSAAVCILGQLEDGYYDGLQTLHLDNDVMVSGNGAKRMSVLFGFSTDGGVARYKELTKLWRKKIASLRRKRAPKKTR